MLLQTKAFWPMQLERPLMDVNIDGHGFHSDPFNYNIADSVLLKMKGQVLLTYCRTSCKAWIRYI